MNQTRRQTLALALAAATVVVGLWWLVLSGSFSRPPYP